MGLQITMRYKKGSTDAVTNAFFRKSDDPSAINVFVDKAAKIENLHNGYEE
jgi:hypothetical protein